MPGDTPAPPGVSIDTGSPGGVAPTIEFPPLRSDVPLVWTLPGISGDHGAQPMSGGDSSTSPSGSVGLPSGGVSPNGTTPPVFGGATSDTSSSGPLTFETGVVEHEDNPTPGAGTPAVGIGGAVLVGAAILRRRRRGTR
ncbi:hypothetical protein ACWDTI_06855 [Gordonia sp. NPDC003424]